MPWPSDGTLPPRAFTALDRTQSWVPKVSGPSGPLAQALAGCGASSAADIAEMSTTTVRRNSTRVTGVLPTDLRPAGPVPVMGNIGGGLHGRSWNASGGSSHTSCWRSPIDVGKRTAAALVCDFFGKVIVPAFTFDLDERGFDVFARAVAAAEDERHASWTCVGLDQAGHYHRVLLAKLIDGGFDVSLLNPAQVKQNRAQDLLRSLKSDARDIGAMAELLIRGKGRPAGAVDEDMASQAALAAHRSRKVKARTALKNQIHRSLDLVFLGLSGCFRDMLDAKLGQRVRAERDPRRTFLINVLHKPTVEPRHDATRPLQPGRGRLPAARSALPAKPPRGGFT